MTSPDRRITEVRHRDDSDRAILFVHGFSGDHQGTWGLFPTLVGTDTSLNEWDILSLGYSTSLLPDIRGIWSADPDLPILAIHLKTRLLDIAPLSQYKSLAIVAHSMGGLVVQRALLDNPALVSRVSHLLLFGTPSGGLHKAGFFAWLMPQLNNMAESGAFISTLRKDWSERFDERPPFRLFVVAGDRDQFVPPNSSLKPFRPSFQRVVAGDHLSMVKPKDAQAESLCLLIGALTAQPEPPALMAPLRSNALDMSAPEVEQALQDREDRLTQAEVVNAAIKFDLDGKRQQAIDLLERHLDLGTDIEGTLGGRFKRLWLETGAQGHAKRALELYQGALETSLAAINHEQVYYHAINLAFLAYVVSDQKDEARALARLALEHCAKTPKTMWRVATEAEAQLYLGEPDLALATYREVLAMGAEHWQLQSAGQQAYQLAKKLGDQALQEKLRTLFNPESREINRIFVSYSHDNEDWLNRLHKTMRPILRKGELQLWSDMNIRPGAEWRQEIQKALTNCKVAVLLVTADFLDSDFIDQHELPEIYDAANRKRIKLLWIHVTPALYKETPIERYQAAYPPEPALASLTVVEQDEALRQIATAIKTAVFDNPGD
jgi:pimeloyl-ACP methyl ester carboxylesterase